MVMPRNFVIVRHGQSEGNVATEAAKNGDTSYYTDDFVMVPGHQWRLTEKGKKQAQAIGRWVSDFNAVQRFSKHFVSTYVRTRETAAHLQLKGAQWTVNRAIRERDWGDIGSVPRLEFQKRYPDNFHQKKIDPLYWAPVGGESIAHVAENRVRNFLSTLHRECGGLNVLAVSHADTMWAFRLVLEYMRDEQFLDNFKDDEQDIRNCEAIHYTSDPVLPEHATARRGKLLAKRHIRPVETDGKWEVEISDWQPITKQVLSNKDLLESIKDVPHLI